MILIKITAKSKKQLWLLGAEYHFTSFEKQAAFVKKFDKWQMLHISVFRHSFPQTFAKHAAVIDSSINSNEHNDQIKKKYYVHNIMKIVFPPSMISFLLWVICHI